MPVVMDRPAAEVRQPVDNNEGFSGDVTPGFKGEPAFRHLVPDLHSTDNGRLNGKQIAVFFDLPDREIARLAGVKQPAFSKTPDARTMQSSLTVFERIAASLLYMVGSRVRALMWMNAPNPALDHETPMALLLAGKGQIVTELLEDTLFGHPG